MSFVVWRRMHLCNREEMKKANYCDEFPSLPELRHVIPRTFRMSSLHTDSSSSLQPEPQSHNSHEGGETAALTVAVSYS